MGKRRARKSRTGKCNAELAKPRGQKFRFLENQRSSNPGIHWHVMFSQGEAARQWASELLEQFLENEVIAAYVKCMFEISSNTTS